MGDRRLRNLEREWVQGKSRETAIALISEYTQSGLPRDEAQEKVFGISENHTIIGEWKRSGSAKHWIKFGTANMLISMPTPSELLSGSGDTGTTITNGNVKVAKSLCGGLQIRLEKGIRRHQIAEPSLSLAHKDIANCKACLKRGGPLPQSLLAMSFEFTPLSCHLGEHILPIFEGTDLCACCDLPE